VQVEEVAEQKDVTVVVVTPGNRDALVSELCELLRQKLV
jgi:nucleoside-triphosphatase THEP1